LSLFLHIISFDNPFPPDYGGVIDVFYKIKALSQQGVHIILHCYHYGRPPSAELEVLCEKVYYYPRGQMANSLLEPLPYIVLSRADPELKKNLLYPEYPILFEGLHTCFLLGEKDFKNRLCMVRTHNVEWQYYKGLAAATWSPLKWFYFRSEADKLLRFEENLGIANIILPISPADHLYYHKKFPQSHYLPCFHPNDTLTSLGGQGKYMLYHGNLAVPENNATALFLLDLINAQTKLPLIIAGMNPGTWLRFCCRRKKVQIIANPGKEEMVKLIAGAHINLLPATQHTGIKLKLLNALYQGRHCIANGKMVNQTGLERLCHIAEKKIEWQQTINKLVEMPMTIEEQEKRQNILKQHYNNVLNAELLIRIIENQLANTSKI